ncbi:hypothetical protein [Leptodesmis sichuanensis]|uniref:hypothetical protein n=1 Tax=Leptodesmis sichuanensis TaxID=2906798 RepID=UPI001F2BDDD4|nr:hypothetical protein [Leptodesmis sichuanensis]UIE37500.1 hypothetical protein KIK02_21595 [Leptodesmis sichuanensis A121]
MTDCVYFTLLNRVAELSKYDISVITGNEPKLFPSLKDARLRKILKIFQLIICHIELGQKVLKNKHRDAVLIHGFSTEFLIFTYAFSLFWTKNVYVLEHHNVQQAFYNPILRLMFKIYHLFGYRYLVNEGSLSPLKNLGFSEQEIDQHISFRFPVERIDPSSLFISDAAIIQLNSNKIKKKKVGLVGRVRQEKKSGRTLNLLLKLQKKLDFLLIIGTNDFSSFSQINLDEAELVNTSSKDNYFAVLTSCDIIVLNYEESKYFYRTSGVAADAIGTRTYVVCPNFPMMSHQLNYPTQVGILYDDESDLEMAIKQALELVPPLENTAFESHYVERSIENIALALTKDIESQIELSR